MAETKKRVRGISRLKIIRHKQVHEIYRRLRQESGKFSTRLRLSDYADLISEETGYATITISKILNKKEIAE